MLKNGWKIEKIDFSRKWRGVRGNVSPTFFYRLLRAKSPKIVPGLKSLCSPRFKHFLVKKCQKNGWKIKKIDFSRKYRGIRGKVSPTFFIDFWGTNHPKSFPGPKSPLSLRHDEFLVKKNAQNCIKNRNHIFLKCGEEFREKSPRSFYSIQK